MSANVRSIPALWSLRQRRNAVDDPQEYEALRDRLADLETELVVEQDAGLLSEALGRPSVTVIDRSGMVGLQDEHPSVEQVLNPARGVRDVLLGVHGPVVDRSRRLIRISAPPNQAPRAPPGRAAAGESRGRRRRGASA
jgi:hypothetical protein